MNATKLKFTGTYQREVPRKVKHREEITPELMRRSSFHVDDKFYREWEE